MHSVDLCSNKIKRMIMKKMHVINKEITVHTSKHDVWELLVNKFGEVNSFNPLIDESHALDDVQGKEGCERHCTIDNKNSVRERISNIRGNESFDVEIVEGGLPMMDQMAGSYNIIELGDEKTKIQMIFKFNTNPGFIAPVLKGMMSKQLHTLMVGTKYHLETGGKVTKENIKSIMKGYDQIGENANFEVLQGEPSLIMDH
jgi:hypothetical protein